MEWSRPFHPLVSCKRSNKTARSLATGYLSLVNAGEPFRLLFPVGTLIGIAGVLMWPLHFWGITKPYPGQHHARVMIEGFLTAFVLGFLGTALPRLLGIPKIRAAESACYATSLCIVALLHATGHTHWGDALFFFTLLTFILALALRAAIFRQDVPPPAFVLVLLGIASALFGSAVAFIATFLPDTSAWLTTFAKLLLYQGFLLFPVMGIGAFLLPRFFGLPNRQSFPESLSLPPFWSHRAAFALFCGLVAMLGFTLEAAGLPRPGNALRALAVLGYFAKELPIHRAQFGGGSLALCLRVALAAISLAFVSMAIWPNHIFSLLHILFISGFSLLTFVVASRVILGHSGQSQKFRATLRPVLVMAGLVLLAAITRVTADWMPAVRTSHYAYAAIAWTIGVSLWAFFVLPSVRQADPDP